MQPSFLYTYFYTPFYFYTPIFWFSDFWGVVEIDQWSGQNTGTVRILESIKINENVGTKCITNKAPELPIYMHINLQKQPPEVFYKKGVVVPESLF